VTVAARAGQVAARRVVLLPGAYQEPEDFVTAGFATAVQARGLDIDLDFVAPQMQHLLDRRILVQLEQELIAPARGTGCRELWLGGVSLGGFIALAYAEQRAATLDGLCLMAPYLGNRMVTGEIARAGGVDAWQPATPIEDDEERRIWVFIQQLGDLPIATFAGYGRSDRFAHGQALLAAALPPDAMQCVDGGHDWPTWLSLWERFLDRLAASGGPNG
jgi:pimeloyl-ACP methyl ester carboxylesterase